MKQIGNPRTTVLSAVLNRVGKYDMNTFKNRLIFQKTTYFLQVFGLSFGYNFNWYVYGPYSSTLTDDGYAMEKMSKIPTIKFVNQKYEESLGKLKKFLSGHEYDDKWLEIMASIHFLKSTGMCTTQNDITELITHKQTHFDKKECREAFMHLKKSGLI